MKEKLLEKLKCLLCKCPYGYHKEADEKNSKPELLLQDYLTEGLTKEYTVKKECSISVDQLTVSPYIYEDTFEYDLYINKEKFHCFVEIKYDEEYKEGGALKSTNTQSEEEISRDAYKLQCLKEKYNNILCLVVFATNKASHWENFKSIPSGVQTVNYNGKEEKFRLLRNHKIVWNEAMNSKYQYCIVEIN